jgi:autotransporter translocation and assembly factor TamB
MVVHNLRSNLVYADELRMELTLNDRALMLEKLSLDYQKQHLKLLAKKKVYDIRTSQLVLDDLKVELTNFSLNNVLRFLGPALKPLKGRLSGNVSVNFKKGNFYFRPENGFRINKLGLVVGDPGSPFQILMVKEGKLNSSEFRIVDSEFQMESKIALKSSVLDISGKINSKGVKFNAGRASVDLEDFGNISNLDIIGQGMLDIDVAGSFDDTVIRLTGPLSNFGVLGYKLGDALVDIAIDLKDSTVRINKLESEYGTTPISGTGSINWSNQDIALGILSSHASYRDLAHILHPIFSKLGFLPSDLDFDAKVDTDIFGKYTLPKLKINARTKIQNIKAYGESIDNAELTVRLADGTLHLAQFHGIKGKGRIDGDFSYVLDTNHFLMNYAWDNLSLTAFNAVKNLNLNLKGKLSGGVKGGGKSDNYKLTLQSRLYDTHSSDFSFADSEIALKIRPSLLSGSTKIMNSVLLSNFEIALDKKYRSKIKIDLNLPDIKPVAVAILGQHIMNEKISGSYYLNIDTSFSHGFTDVDLFLKLSQMTFQHESFSVNYLSDSPQFLIDNSRIKKWDFSIREPDLLVTNGEGEFGKNVSLIHEFHVNSKILELLFAPVLSAEGFVRNIIRVDGVGNNYVLSATSKTNNLDLTIDEVPFPLNDINFHLDFNQNRLLVQNFSTALENGSVALKGDIYFDDNEPDINLKFLLDKAEIPILGKSIINLSGEGIILGNKMPYGLSGEIIVNKAQIINELNEFNTKSSALNQVRFLPKNQESPFGKIFNLNLNVKAENPIKISNSLMDVGLKGELVLLGNPVRPRAEGRLYAPVNSSRVFFKNNEYFITNADLNFNPKKDISNPDFDVQAYTFISNYKVSAKAYGDLERFNFDLTSDPVLPRSSILSLIAFGYTDEIQSTLTSGEQQNLTQVGVGSFVF